MSRRGEGEIRTSQTGKTERRGDEIMGNWSRESGMKSGEERSWLPYPKAVLI